MTDMILSSLISPHHLVRCQHIRTTGSDVTYLRDYICCVFNEENMNFYKKRFDKLIPYTTDALYSVEMSLEDVTFSRRRL